LFDGVEVWGVFRQGHEGMSVLFEECFDLGFVVEWRVIHDDQGVRLQLWQQGLFYPHAHGEMCTTAFKQHRCQPLLATLRHDEVGCLTVVARDFTKDLHAALCPAVRPVAVFGKAALVKVDHVLAAVFGDPMTQVA